MRFNRLLDLPPDPHDRVQRGGRVLEDHADLAATNLAHVALGEAEKVAPGKRDTPGDDLPRLRYEAHDRQRQHRLAAAGLADDADDLARSHAEGDAVHRFDDAARARDGDAEPFYGEDGLAAHGTGCNWSRGRACDAVSPAKWQAA